MNLPEFTSHSKEIINLYDEFFLVVFLANKKNLKKKQKKIKK